MPFSHGVVDESSFFYTKSSLDSKEMFLISGKSWIYCNLLHIISVHYPACQSSINMWSLQNGHKLQSIPVPADSHHHLPAVCFTHHYSGGSRYCPVLIVGIGSSLKAYSVFSWMKFRCVFYIIWDAGAGLGFFPLVSVALNNLYSNACWLSKLETEVFQQKIIQNSNVPIIILRGAYFLWICKQKVCGAKVRN